MNDTMLDRESLHTEFDMDPIEEEVREISRSISDDPTVTLGENINRANDILDMLEREMRAGNLSARIAEVAGQLINSITNASKEIITNTNYKTYLQIREKMIGLKELEIKIKEKQLRKPSNQNLIIADREAVLRLLEDKQKEKQEEQEVKQLENVVDVS